MASMICIFSKAGSYIYYLCGLESFGLVKFKLVASNSE